MIHELSVYHEARLVGTVSEDEGGDRFAFAYAPSWLDDPAAFAISLSMPLRDQLYRGDVAHAFFANLLPEARVRTLVARRLGLSEDNDLGLLAALGGDCAGALVIAETPPEPGEHSYRALADAELEELVSTGAVFAQLSGHDGIRLSLAGAQDKLPVRVADDGSLLLPRGSSPSTHLLKFASRDFAHLPANEGFTGALARAMGLPAVDAELREIAGTHHLLVRRYDRSIAEDGRVTRLHQEDLCQAVGARPTRKYEQEGGPSFAQCFAVVADHSTEPALDTAALLRWMAFNAVVGNADGHAKNLSLLHTAGGQLRLAPFYDLVCTAAYPRLDRKLAMSVGENADPGQIRGRDWRQLAQTLGVRPAFVVNLVRETAERALPRAEAAAESFRAQYGDSPALQRILPRMRKQARRTLELLSE